MKILFITLLIGFQAYAFGKKAPPPILVEPIPSATAAPTAPAQATQTPTPGKTIDPYWKTPTGADMRACDGPIENQQTPWCTAFSFAGILENMICNHQRLSIHHVWSFYEQYSVDDAAAKAVGHNITTWDEWPEASNNPKPDFQSFAKNQITGMKYIDADDDIAAALKVLDSGRPVYVGMSLPADMENCNAVIRTTTSVTQDGHALEIVGYGSDPKIPGGAYFIFKQSWGPDCGDGGYQFVSTSVFDLPGMYAEFYEPVAAK